MWAQIPQPFEVKSVGGSSSWMPVLIASIPAVGALIVVLVAEVFQHRRFDRQRAAEGARWSSDRELERQRWVEAREAEREKQLLTERLQTYAAFLAALEELAEAGKALAQGARTPRRQGTLEDLNRLLAALQSDPNASGEDARRAIADLRPEAERWEVAYNAAYRTGTQTALIANERYRNAVVEVLMFCGSLTPPDGVPDDWIAHPGVVGSAPTLSELWRHRNSVELIARRELGLTGGGPGAGSTPGDQRALV